MTSTVPFGFKSEILVVQQPPAITRLTTWPAVPVKVRLAFWPGTVVVTVFGTPNAIVPVTSAGTSYSVKVTSPVAGP